MGFEVQATLFKARTGLATLLLAARVCAFTQRVSGLLAATHIVFALFLRMAGMDSRQSRRQGGRFLRYAAPALLVLLGPALLWASFATAFQGIATLLSTGSVTLGSPVGVAVDSLEMSTSRTRATTRLWR